VAVDFLVAMLADSIEIEGDLVTLRNGAFAYVPVDAVPTSLELNLLLVLVAEADEVRDITIRCHVAGPDGTYVPGGFEALVASPEVSTLVTGQPVIQPIHVPLRFVVSEEGRHTAAVFLDDEQSNRTSVPFAVVRDR
jgi:hypothetical protein